MTNESGAEFSKIERMTYGRVRHAASGLDGWVAKPQVKVSLVQEFDSSKIDQALHDLYRAGLIETDNGRYRPTDPDRRIPHPGEIHVSGD